MPVRVKKTASKQESSAMWRPVFGADHAELDRPAKRVVNQELRRPFVGGNVSRDRAYIRCEQRAGAKP
jgi:hypothetical protein